MTVRHVRVGDVLRLERTRLHPDAGATYRQIGIYSWGKGIIENPPIQGSELSKVAYYRFPADALVLSNIQAWEAAIAVSDKRHSDEFIASQRFLPYVPVDQQEVDTRFLLHFFLSDPGMALIRKASPGTVTRNRTLGMKAFEELQIPLPSIADQRAIVKDLSWFEGIRSAVKQAGEDARRVMNGLRQRTIDAAAALGEPVRLGSVLELARRPVQVEPQREYLEIGVRSFGRGIFHKEPVSGASLGEKRVFRVAEGDLVVSNVFAWEGAVAMATASDAGRIGSHRFMTWITTSEKIDPNYLCQYLTSDRGVAQLLRASPGSAGRNKTLAIQAFQDLEIAIPDLGSQLTAVARLNRLAEVRSLTESRWSMAEASPQAARNEVFSKFV